ncbi:MAG TPA: MerR family transcriptional regulator [Solirubrobacteraceae bacterium]
MATLARPTGHGSLPASEVGELVGVSGTTIGQWARRGYIRSSQQESEPRRYAFEDVAEAAIVRNLLARGVPHPEVLRAVQRLQRSGRPWPLNTARLATRRDASGRAHLLMHEGDVWLELTARGWQTVAPPDDLEDVVLRLRQPTVE